MRCQESQIMCSKRKAHSYAYICIYTKLCGLLDKQNGIRFSFGFMWPILVHHIHPSYISWPVVSISALEINSYCTRMSSKDSKFPFHGCEFLQCHTLEKRKVMEKQEGINNCEECGMFNGTLGPYVDWLFRFLLCNSSRSLLVQLPHSSFLKLLMEMNRSVLYWVVSTSREQYSLSMARACFWWWK